MADKFAKLSIYDVDFKLKDGDGVEHTFTFKPLPFKDYPKLYDVLNSLSKLDGLDDEKQFFNKIESSDISKIAELEKAMVKKSYPDKRDEDVENFVQSNLFDLINPLIEANLKKDGQQDKRTSGKS